MRSHTGTSLGCYLLIYTARLLSGHQQLTLTEGHYSSTQGKMPQHEEHKLSAHRTMNTRRSQHNTRHLAHPEQAKPAHLKYGTGVYNTRDTPISSCNGNLMTTIETARRTGTNQTAALAITLKLSMVLELNRPSHSAVREVSV